VVVTLFTVMAVVCNVGFVWPQAFRLARTRKVDGVSPWSWTASVILFSIWATFALRTHYWALFVANASCLVASLLILAVGTSAGWSWRWTALAGSGIVIAVAVSVLAPLLLAIVMTMSGAVLRLPQLVSLLRSASTGGVSAATWWLSCLTSGSWLVVSLHRTSTPVVVASGTALAMSLLIVGMLYWRRTRPRYPAVPAPATAGRRTGHRP
jgi:uncharacterized protein with PQ loop repeat